MARQGIALCNKINERLLPRHMGTKCFAQPKLNGMRGWTDWSIQALCPDLISSGGLQLRFFEHIQEELLLLRQHLGYERPYDGEIYKHLMGVEDIHSIARRTVNRKDGLLDYWIFDTKDKLPQYMRIDEINEAKKVAEAINLKHIKIIPTYPILTSEWRNKLTEFILNKYEGIILRKWDGPYVERKSNYILKYKATELKKYKITGVEQGEGWCYDRAGSIYVSSSDTGEFAVGSGRLLTAAGRLDIWKKRNLIVGEYLTVKHEKQITQTNTGKPRGCNAWAIEGIIIDF